MDINKQIQELVPEMIRLRRDFHQYPELGFKEFRTQKKIMEYLSDLCLASEKIAGTGVKAVLEGRQPGRTILLRSDMDALPVTELTGLKFASRHDGIMHACGHDGHMAMLLGTAKYLSSVTGEFSGRVVFCFQPNEEEAGAYRMIDEGILKDPGVDAAVGCHLWSRLESGRIDVSAGPIMAASHYFTIKITGKGGHAGFAHESVDPVLTAAHVVQACQAIQTRQINALDPAVIMFTKVCGGTSPTIIPQTVELQGSIRFLFEGGQMLLEQFEQTVHDICQAHGAKAELTFQVGNHMLSNNENMARIAEQTARKILSGPDRVSSRERTMAGEDFSEFAMRVPSVFAFIGCKNKEKKTDYPHHHPRFDIDEEVLTIGARFFAGTALAFLNKEEK